MLKGETHYTVFVALLQRFLKLSYLLLMNKLSAVSKYRRGSSKALLLFGKHWLPCFELLECTKNQDKKLIYRFWIYLNEFCCVIANKQIKKEEWETNAIIYVADPNLFTMPKGKWKIYENCILRQNMRKCKGDVIER